MRVVGLGFVVALLLPLAVAQQAGPALTAQQVVARSLAARGGASRFAAVHSLHFQGSLDLGQGQAAPISAWCADSPARIRIEVMLPQGKMVQGYDGTRAWQVNPGATHPTPLDSAEARRIEDQALNFVDLVADSQAKLALLGQGQMEGHDYYKISFTLASGDAFVQYIDTHTWLAFHEEYPGGVEEISDYRKVDGLLLPFEFVSGPAGQPATKMERVQVSLNAPVPASLFRAPN